MAKVRRELKNVVYNYTDAEVKVREATSNDPWGPSSTIMTELAEYTFHVQAYSLVMGMLWKRLNDHGKNWRHVYKSLVLLEYLVKNGSQRVVQQCKDNIFSIETLKDFQFIDKDEKDHGALVREKAKTLATLIKDDQLIEEERTRAAQVRQRSNLEGLGSNLTTSRSPRRSRTPERNETSGPKPGDAPTSPGVRFEPHITQSRPNAKDEEDLQLQLAIRMSKEAADSEEKLRKQEEESLRLALELSKKDASQEDEEQEDEEEEDTSNPQEEDLLGLGDPWAKTTEAPPSYDIVAGVEKPDPWKTGKTSPTDPFSGKDPFDLPPVTVTDPWVSVKSTDTSVERSSPPFGGDSFVTDTTDPWTSFDNTTTTTTNEPNTIPSLPPLDIGLLEPTTTTTTNPYDFSAFNTSLDVMGTTSQDNAKKPTVEESFLGSNAELVNLDSLIAPLPPSTGVNPFGLPIPVRSTPPTSRSTNPFDSSKPPAPTLQQLQVGDGFDPLPPPLIPTSQPPNQTFNPFT